MHQMKRLSQASVLAGFVASARAAAAVGCVAAASTALLLSLLPSSAAATELELGSTTTPLVTPTCPTNTKIQCNIVLTQVTAYETVRDGITNPTLVKKAGEIVALSVGISPISSDTATKNSDISNLELKYGGPPEIEVAILRRVGPALNYRWSVAAESQPIELLPYIGQVVQFPLVQPMPVVPGEVVAVSVPTWAPILTIDVASGTFQYRQSRGDCTKTTTASLAQLTIGDMTNYACVYKGSRLEYSATEVTSPTPTS